MTTLSKHLSNMFSRAVQSPFSSPDIWAQMDSNLGEFLAISWLLWKTTRYFVFSTKLLSSGLKIGLSNMQRKMMEGIFLLHEHFTNLCQISQKESI